MPPFGAGTSMVALSVSRVIRPVSASILSPTATSTSITSTLESPPISGTVTSITPPASAGAATGATALATGAAVFATAAGAGAAGASAALLLPATSNNRTRLPSETLSPTLIFISLTTPACGEGTSMVALSVSRVIRPVSASILSPTATSTSMTSTSLSPPISGTVTSITLADCGAAALATGAGAAAGAGAGAGAEAATGSAAGAALAAPDICIIKLP